MKVILSVVVWLILGLAAMDAAQVISKAPEKPAVVREYGKKKDVREKSVGQSVKVNGVDVIQIVSIGPRLSPGGAGGGGPAPADPPVDLPPKIDIRKQPNEDIFVDVDPCDVHVDLDGSGFAFLFRAYQPTTFKVFPSIRHQPTVQFRADKTPSTPQPRRN